MDRAPSLLALICLLSLVGACGDKDVGDSGSPSGGDGGGPDGGGDGATADGGGDGGLTDGGTGTIDADFCDLVEIFDAHCIACHSVSGGLSGGLDLQVAPYDNLVDVPSTLWTTPRVTPSSTEDSLIYLKVAGLQGDQGESMPYGDVLTYAEGELVRVWISDGALPDSCADAGSTTGDGGSSDGGSSDGGSSDGGSSDGGSSDGGSSDGGSTTGSYDLQLDGSAWSTVHAGQDFALNVVRDRDGDVVATHSQVLESDTVSVRFDDLLDGGEAYTLDYYADHNGNGDCDPVPDDHVWHQALGVVSGDSSVRIDHSGATLDSAGCGSF